MIAHASQPKGWELYVINKPLFERGLFIAKIIYLAYSVRKPPSINFDVPKVLLNLCARLTSQTILN